MFLLVIFIGMAIACVIGYPLVVRKWHKYNALFAEQRQRWSRHREGPRPPDSTPLGPVLLMPVAPFLLMLLAAVFSLALGIGAAWEGWMLQGGAVEMIPGLISLGVGIMGLGGVLFGGFFAADAYASQGHRAPHLASAWSWQKNLTWSVGSAVVMGLLGSFALFP